MWAASLLTSRSVHALFSQGRETSRTWQPCLEGLCYRRLRRELEMTFVVTDNCIKCKYTDCVEVCPVDC
ncbi:MAG TPA: hypothetical protein VF682_09960, partial [Pseudomonas sp.]